ncbi:MAG: tRNA modification GTPase [Gemmataceae bacterium]|nr:tRNA modification GTPase [Gemmataceae bacterium]
MTPNTNLPDLNDTIVALSSAPGPAARAIMRLSGRRSAAIARVICREFDKDAVPAGHLHSGHLHLASFRQPIAADIYHFVAPRTYTGQDIIEIHTISCQPIVDAVIAGCLNAGARAAQPGEFTMHAFLAGKLDLTRAEAVLGVIEASDRHELKQALAQLAGGMAQPLQTLRDDLLNLLADVEAGLDFTEEDIRFVAADDLLRRLARGLAHLVNLRKQLDQRALGQRPFRVVLAGEPNAGKSSLFNALVGRAAALVSAEAGTTRDYLVKTIDLGGVSIELVDTAGLRAPASAIESDAQSLGKEQTRQADLVLVCMPCDRPQPAGAALPNTLSIATKADRAPAPPNLLATSATTGAGLAELRRLLADRVRRAGHTPLAPSLSRCRHHVEACFEHLQHAHAIVIQEELPEILALELRLALEELGAMTGAIYTNDLLDRIFSRFCIGK